jgi:hypothetical protein
MFIGRTACKQTSGAFSSKRRSDIPYVLTFLSDPRVDLPLNDQRILYIKEMQKCFKNETLSAPREMSIFKSFTP